MVEVAENGRKGAVGGGNKRQRSPKEASGKHEQASLVRLGVVRLVKYQERDLTHVDEAVRERVEQELSRENEAADFEGAKVSAVNETGDGLGTYS